MKTPAKQVGVVLALLTGTALATVYPAPFVVSNWIEKMGGVRTIHVHQKTTIFDEKFPDGSVTVDEEIWIRRPAEYRRVTSYPNGKLEMIVGKDRAARVWAGKVEPVALAESVGILGGLYLYSDRGRLSSFLRQASVDLARTRWVLRDGQIGLEIGDPTGARITFSKAESVPMGAELGDRSYRFDSSGSSRFPIRYPSRVEVTIAGRTVERVEVDRVETNLVIPDARFEIPRLRTSPEKK